MAKKSKKTFAQLRSEILIDEEPEDLSVKPPENVAEKFVAKPPEASSKNSVNDRSFFDSTIFWRVGAALVIVTATILRFYDLLLKPFHHDEGVNGFFLVTLFRSGTYQYDPQNYHGPTLYYFALASSYLFGLNDFGVRFVTAIFGVLCVVLILFLRRYLGTIGALTAAMLIALSPGMVFISRYFIHEMLFVFFTLAVPFCAIKFIERGRAGSVATGAMAILLLICLLPGTLNLTAQIGGTEPETKIIVGIMFFIVEVVIVVLLTQSLLLWENGRPIYLLLGAACAALTFATKETAFISFGTMLIAVFCVATWLKIWQPGKNNIWREPVELGLKNFRLSFAEPNSLVLTAILCFLVFGYVNALFFSSFFTFPEGINRAFEAYSLWTQTGSKDHTQNGFFAYLKWLWTMEGMLLALGALGTLIAFGKAKHRFAIFAALWAWGLFAAYSIIPYKTPWLAINFVLPLGLIAGYGINELATSHQQWKRGAAAFLAAVAFGTAAYQSINLNFYRYDDDSRPYVYAHSKREFNDLIKNIRRAAEVSGRGKEASILIVSPDYWPMPWSLREYSGTAFFGRIQPAENAEVIVGSVAQAAELDAKYSNTHDFIGTYPLRPGVDLMLYVRTDLTDRVTAK